MTSEQSTSYDATPDPAGAASGSQPAPTPDYGASPARAGSFPGETPPHRVLVVESDIETADLLVGLMENVGYEVEVATDGNYALMLMDKFEPELILLQLDMQGMSGYEVTQVLRNEPRYAQRFRFTRIFYITDKEQMLQKRFDALPGTPISDYIFTPIDIPELIDKVARAFGEPSHLSDV